MILTAVFIAFLVSAVFFYNQLAKLEALVFESQNGIFSLTEKLSILCKQIQNALPDTSNIVISEISSDNVEKMFQTEKDMEKYIENALKETLESNSDLNSFRQEYETIKKEIQLQRRKYNAAVRYYNVALHTVPTSWIAKLTKAEEKIFFKVD